MRSGLSIAMLLMIGAGTATAETSEDNAPAEHWQGGVEAEWMPAGSILYSGNYGEGDFDVDTAWGSTTWIGYEMEGGFEIGAAIRFIGHEHISGTDMTGEELDVGPRLAFHTHTSKDLEVSFAIEPAYSTIYLPSWSQWPDPSGFTVDLVGGLMYRIQGRLWGIATLGYQRGFQRTTEVYLKMDAVTAFATDYGHLGAGVAYRF